MVPLIFFNLVSFDYFRQIIRESRTGGVLTMDGFHSILDGAYRRENAILKLFKREQILKNVWKKIQEELNFEFVSIQLIHPEEQTIEAVYGVEWAGQAKHYIEKSSKLNDFLDIQADIVQTCKTEIIAGWDIDPRFENKNHNISRFDEWIYNRFEHKNLIRIFSPIFIIQDDQGNVDKTWFNNIEYEVTRNKINSDWFNWIPEERPEKLNGQHTVIELCFSDIDKKRNQRIVKVLGTIEVGYTNPKKNIEIEQAIELIKLGGKSALDIYSTLLTSVLKDIADSARTIVKANSTTLHFLIDSTKNCLVHQISCGKITPINQEENKDKVPYLYNVFSGELGGHFLIDCPPRQHGLGKQAIHEKRYKFIDDSQLLKKSNPKILKKGIRTIAAFPLLIDDLQGVLYISFKQEHQFTESELGLIDIFAKGAIHAIRHAINYEETRKRKHQLLTLQKISQSLAQTPDEQSLLEEIAWSTLNLVGADIVSIYEYIEGEKTFSGKLATAGKLKSPQKLLITQEKHYVPFQIITQSSNLYISDVNENAIFHPSVFTRRERIKSVAAIPLKLGKGKLKEEIVGVMLIDYRRPHEFSQEDKNFINTLASSAAIALDNQRWLTTLREIDQEIINTLDEEQLLNLIVKKAKDKTHADLADIRYLEPIKQELEMKVWLPNEQRDASIKIKLGEGITGWVAQNKKSALVNNTLSDPLKRYKSIYARSKSELCVPLLNKNSLIGVLNVESKATEAFTLKDQQKLEVLAGQAVIGIQNMQSKEQLVAMEKLSTFGEFSTLWIHRIGNYLSAVKADLKTVKELTDRVKVEINEEIQKYIMLILEQVDELSNLAKKQKIWFDDKLQVVNLCEILCDPITFASLPSQIQVFNKIPKPCCFTILGGQEQLRQIFHNLIQNARDAMPNGGTLALEFEIREQEGKKWGIVTIKDTGKGIDKQKQSKIFQIGYSTKKSHVGLGLWWSKIYIQRLGGSLTLVESDINQGTTFAILLPAHDSD